MQLQITTDYAIRMIGYLAQHNDQLVTARSMAGELGITYQYSMKVINQLKRANLVYSVQGCNGGYRLTDEAANATFYDIICLMEGNINLNRCVEGNRFCERRQEDLCEIHNVLKDIQDDLIRNLKNKVIVDIWTRDKPLKPAPLTSLDELSQTG